MSRLFALLLVLTLLVPSGIGRLDLCGCEGSGHGVLCGQTSPPTPSAPTPSAQSCCAQRAEAETGEASEEEPCPGCPELDLGDQDLTGVSAASAAESDLGSLHALLPGEPRPSARAGRIATPQWPRPPPGPQRLHLLLQVFLR